jgi:hypothetical protein
MGGVRPDQSRNSERKEKWRWSEKEKKTLVRELREFARRPGSCKSVGNRFRARGLRGKDRCSPGKRSVRNALFLRIQTNCRKSVTVEGVG